MRGFQAAGEIAREADQSGPETKKLGARDASEYQTSG
jgi:hypothetical protein